MGTFSSLIIKNLGEGLEEFWRNLEIWRNLVKFGGIINLGEGWILKMNMGLVEDGGIIN